MLERFRGLNQVELTEMREVARIEEVLNNEKFNLDASSLEVTPILDSGAIISHKLSVSEETGDEAPQLNALFDFDDTIYQTARGVDIFNASMREYVNERGISLDEEQFKKVLSMVEAFGTWEDQHGGDGTKGTDHPLAKMPAFAWVFRKLDGVPAEEIDGELHTLEKRLLTIKAGLDESPGQSSKDDPDPFHFSPTMRTLVITDRSLAHSPKVIDEFDEDGNKVKKKRDVDQIQDLFINAYAQSEYLLTEIEEGMNELGTDVMNVSVFTKGDPVAQVWKTLATILTINSELEDTSSGPKRDLPVDMILLTRRPKGEFMRDVFSLYKEGKLPSQLAKLFAKGSAIVLIDNSPGDLKNFRNETEKLEGCDTSFGTVRCNLANANGHDFGGELNVDQTFRINYKGESNPTGKEIALGVAHVAEKALECNGSAEARHEEIVIEASEDILKKDQSFPSAIP